MDDGLFIQNGYPPMFLAVAMFFVFFFEKTSPTPWSLTLLLRHAKVGNSQKKDAKTHDIFQWSDFSFMHAMNSGKT